MRSRLYNRTAWNAAPADYSRFAAAAFASSDGPLLEAAAGSAAATAELHASSHRPTVLADLSRSMLERAARRIAAADDARELPAHIRLVQADLTALPFSPHGFTTVLGLGLIHLFDDAPELVGKLRAQLAPGGKLYLAGLVAETRRAGWYLKLLHRAGEIATPRTSEELYVQLGRPAEFSTTGCMAYFTLPAA